VGAASPTDAIQRHLRALWRAEMLIAQIKLGALMKKGGLMLFAGLVAVFGLATLNFAAYRALAPLWGEVWALVAVAAADFVIAGILALVAMRSSEAPELQLANELRDQAIAALELDVRLAVDEVRRPVQLAGSASAILASIITALLRARRRGRDG
jgi:uncharacterized membrane protein